MTKSQTKPTDEVTRFEIQKKNKKNRKNRKIIKKADSDFDDDEYDDDDGRVFIDYRVRARPREDSSKKIPR